MRAASFESVATEYSLLLARFLRVGLLVNEAVAMVGLAELLIAVRIWFKAD